MKRNIFAFLALVLSLFTGCTATVYDNYGSGGARFSQPYATSTGSSWVVNDAYQDYGTPFYINGGINYYYVSGRYLYYVNGRRRYVSSLPRGGYYNHQHPLYGRGPAVIRGYSAPAPAFQPPAYAPSARPSSGFGWFNSRPPSSSQPTSGDPHSRSFPSSPYSGGSRRLVPPPSSSPQIAPLRTPHTAPATPEQPPRLPSQPRPEGRPVAPTQPGGVSVAPRPVPPSAAPAAPQGAPKPSRPASPKKKADEPESKTNPR